MAYPLRVRQGQLVTDDGLEDMSWIYGVGAESSPAASYGILQT